MNGWQLEQGSLDNVEFAALFEQFNGLDEGQHEAFLVSHGAVYAQLNGAPIEHKYANSTDAIVSK